MFLKKKHVECKLYLTLRGPFSLKRRGKQILKKESSDSFYLESRVLFQAKAAREISRAETKVTVNAIAEDLPKVTMERCWKILLKLRDFEP